MEKISKDDRALIECFTLGEKMDLTMFFGEFLWNNWGRASVDQLLKNVNSTGMTESFKGSGCSPQPVRKS